MRSPHSAATVSRLVFFQTANASPRPTGERVQLSGQRGHHHVVLHDVGHLVLKVLLVERDQGVGAGIPNLKVKLVMPAVSERLA